MRRLLLLLTLCGCSLSGDELSDSIVPVVRELEEGDLLTASKFSEDQWQEIQQAKKRLDEKLRIVSFNILFTLYEKDTAPIHKWENRKPRVFAALRSHDADVILPQEVLKDQLEDLLGAIGGDYDFVGVPAHDGVLRGEANGVFYRRDRLELVDSQVIWLSETPDVPSRDPHNKTHTLTIATLRDRKTGHEFTVGNTHVAFGNIESRNYSVKQIAAYAEELSGEAPFIMCGDFNAFPQCPEQRFPFLDGDYIERCMTAGAMRNALGYCILGRLGPISTFTNSGASDTRPFRGTGTPGVMLDKAYVSPQVTVLMQAVDTVRVDGQYPSDHMPLILDVVLN